MFARGKKGEPALWNSHLKDLDASYSIIFQNLYNYTGANFHRESTMVITSCGVVGTTIVFVQIPQRGNQYCIICITRIAEMSTIEKARELFNKMHHTGRRSFSSDKGSLVSQLRYGPFDYMTIQYGEYLKICVYSNKRMI